jgi:pimeloyl-ACP methyl ester carboxylesterase
MWCGTRIAAFLLAAIFCSPALCQESSTTTKNVQVNGVGLHYVEKGVGPATVFVHGSVEDYRAWEAQVPPLSKQFRVIAYSRRYNYPNHNSLRGADHSALVEAEDLAALIQKLRLGPANIVGHSYGAFTSLFLATRHPELVRTLVLSEPPVLGWLRDFPGGDKLFSDFMNDMWKPAATAFREGDDEGALRITVDWFGSHEFPTVGEKMTYATLSREVHRYSLENLLEWRALTTSRDAFPSLSRDEIRQVRKPVLILTGDHSLEELKLIAAELARLVPNAKLEVLAGATHEMWNEFPELCTKKLLEFYAAQKPVLARSPTNGDR